MKQYKFLNDVYSYSVQDKINELAADGWVLKSFNISYKGENNDEETCFILMEYDDAVDYIEGIYERIGNIFDQLSRINQSIEPFNDFDIIKMLKEIKETLEFIEGNTSH